MFPVKTAGVVKLIKRLMIMPGQITHHAHTLIFIQIRKHAVKELVTAVPGSYLSFFFFSMKVTTARAANEIIPAIANTPAVL